jgi:hypothetical protein
MMAQEHSSTSDGSGDERDDVHKRIPHVLALTLPAPGEPSADEEQEIDLVEMGVEATTN